MTFNLKLGETVVCEKIGNTIQVPMTLCPFQPTINTIQDLPTFFYYNGTGNYYGVAGSYESIPAFNSDVSGYRFVQAALFSLNASGISDSENLMPNPFLYHPKITTTYGTAFPRLTFPDTQNANHGNTCLGYDGLYCSNIPIVNTISPYNGFFYCETKIPFIGALNFTQKLIGIENKKIIGQDLSVGRNVIFNDAYIEYLIQDDFLSQIFCNNTVRSFNNTTTHPAKATLTMEPQVISFGGKIVPLNAFASSNISVSPISIKINPRTGVFLGNFVFINSVFPATNNWCGNVAGVGSALGDYTFFISKLRFSDLDDETFAVANKGWVQQCMGGGFLLNMGGTVFYVTENLRNYVRLSLNTPPTTYRQANIAMDGSGFIYVLRYNNIGDGFSGLYWSGGSPLSILLPIPTLTGMNVNGINCGNCNPW